MGWNFLERLADWFGGANTAADSPDVETDDSGGRAAESSLFYCDACEVTFISREMDVCPRCDRAVDQVPNERELDRSQVQ